MHTYFVDTAHWLALVSPRDSWNSTAKKLAASLTGRFVTSDFVLLEVADGLAAHGASREAVRIADFVRKKTEIHLVKASPDVLKKAWDLYNRRADMSWSLTDCTSFVIMEQMEISEALTADRHFEQAGFVALYRTLPTV